VVFTPTWNFGVKDWVLGIVVGLLLRAGGLALFAAFRWGKASVVTPLTALYPLVTVILAVAFLHERLHPIKTVAIAVSLLAGMARSKE
jgi:bacterial/archaeal transporter family protein